MDSAVIRAVVFASLLAGALLLHGKLDLARPHASWGVSVIGRVPGLVGVTHADFPVVAPAVRAVTTANTSVRPSTTPLSSDECPAGAPCASAHAGGTAVAIYLVGLKRRLLLNSTLERAVQPLREAAFGVHFYALLVDNSSGIGNWLRVRSRGVVDPTIADLHGEGLRGNIRDRMAAAGACLMCLELQTTPEPLPVMPRYPEIMTQYSPASHPTGQRVARVWLARERLWNLTLANEALLGFEYKFLMWVRDDTHWVKRWHPTQLFSSPLANITVWSSVCGAEGGISDKTVIFGRKAAPAVLTLFTAYMIGSVRGRVGGNAEAFLRGAATKGGIKRQIKLVFGGLPVVPAMLIDLGTKNSSNVTLCIVGRYWCWGSLAAANITGEACETFDERLRQQEKQRPKPRR